MNPFDNNKNNIHMKAKTIQMTKEYEEYIEKKMQEYSLGKWEDVKNNPYSVIETVIEICKRECAKNGEDYTSTDIYQEELKLQQRQADERASFEKWKHLDTPQGIELYEMAIDRAWKENMLSQPTRSYMYGQCRNNPAVFKVVMDVIVTREPARALGKKVADELIRFNEFYDQNYSLDMFEQLPRKEQLLRYAAHIVPNLTAEQQQFVSQFIDEHDHLPMFRLIMAYYENSEDRRFAAAREYYGLCGGERKSLEQIQAELGLSRQRTAEIIRRGFPGGLYSIDTPRSCWEAYRPLFTAHLLRADNCHSEQIKEEEQLHMDVNDFMQVIIKCFPWVLMVFSPKRGDDREWGISYTAARLFWFYTFFYDLRQEQIRKDRPKTVTFDLSRICKSKKYCGTNQQEQTPEESAMIISIIKTIAQEMLGIEAKGNKIIFPAKKK